MRALLLSVLLVVSLATAGLVAAQETDADRPNACVGTIEERPDRSTIVSIQGSRVTSEGAFKTQALLLSFAPNGSFEWVQNSSANGRWWAYDVDPMDDGNLLYATTEPGYSVVGEFDPDAGEYEWVERFNGSPDSETNPLVFDAHDADLVGDDELVMVDKGEGHNRVLWYNLTTDRVSGEWRFDEHLDTFPRSGGGPEDDWTHVNDVDQINEHLYVVSPRNFDQVAIINRTSGAVELVLGEDDNHEFLNEQHNPDHLWGPNGEHTLLVADSLNDRVVEFEYQADTDSWEQVWSVTGFDEPRDADRLANGNTLIADRRGHRVVEVTPEGRTLWEVYTPYEPYDVERGDVDESNGPTMAEHDVSGQFEVSNDAGFTTEEIETCADVMFEYAAPERNFGGVDTFNEGTSDASASVDGTDDDGEDSDDNSSVLPFLLAGGVGLLVALGIGVGWYRYR